MSFDWCDYLTLAKELWKQAATSVSPEASLRSSLSRAYYATFQIARQDLMQNGEYSPSAGGNVHAHVRDAFRQDVDESRRKIGIELDRLRHDRNAADYDDEVQGLDPMARSALIRAQRVLSSLGHS